MTVPIRSPAPGPQGAAVRPAPWPATADERAEPSGRPASVADAMSWGPVTVSPDAPALFAVSLATSKGFAHLPVRAGGQLVGMLCTCDLRDASPRTVVAERMSVPVHVTEEDETLRSAATRMKVLDIGCLPVVVAGRIYGILTRGDLRRAGLLRGDLACVTCGSRHHVRGQFCLECLDSVEPGPFFEHYVDIGGGD